MKEILQATVIYKAKDWPGDYGTRTKAKVRLADGTEKNIGAKPGSPKSKYLFGLQVGDKVPVYWDKLKDKNGKTTEYLDIDVWSLVGGNQGATSEAPSTDKKQALIKAKERLSFFYREALDTVPEGFTPGFDLNAAGYTLMRLTDDIMKGRA